MIDVSGWLRYDSGDVYLTFEDPTTNDFENSLIVACGDEYVEGDKRSYLKEISVIDLSFWDHFTEDELENLLCEDDISFDILMLDHEVRTIIANNNTQESELEDDEDSDVDETVSNENKTSLKQKPESFIFSLSSLI